MRFRRRKQDTHRAAPRSQDQLVAEARSRAEKIIKKGGLFTGTFDELLPEADLDVDAITPESAEKYWRSIRALALTQLMLMQAKDASTLSALFDVDGEWTAADRERYVHAFQGWLAEGNAPTVPLFAAFAYSRYAATAAPPLADGELTPDMRKFFTGWFGAR